MKSPKEISLEKKIRKKLKGRTLEAAAILFQDPEIKLLQDYANTVSIKRLGFNDHGPVHMRTVALNGITIVNLLHTGGIQLTLEQEDIGTVEDSSVAILMAAFLHDVGMTVGRDGHENAGAILAMPILNRMLDILYRKEPDKQIILRSLVIECILGHMATQQIHSREAGVILIADGCDMEKGRARIPILLSTESRVGDIHKYSSASIEKVRIDQGKKRPVRIEVDMNDSIGFYQIEEVLFRKIKASPIKEFIELYAWVIGKEMKCYL